MRPLFIFEFLGCKPFKQHKLGPKFISDTGYGKSRREVCFSRELRESLKNYTQSPLIKNGDK